MGSLGTEEIIGDLEKRSSKKKKNRANLGAFRESF